MQPQANMNDNQLNFQLESSDQASRIKKAAALLGSMTSPKKKISSAANGKLGGCPPILALAEELHGYMIANGGYVIRLADGKWSDKEGGVTVFSAAVVHKLVRSGRAEYVGFTNFGASKIPSMAKLRSVLPQKV
jgi:hypothetical protein